MTCRRAHLSVVISAIVTACAGSSALAGTLPAPAALSPPQNYTVVVFDLTAGPEPEQDRSGNGQVLNTFSNDEASGTANELVYPQTSAKAAVYNGNAALVENVQSFTTGEYQFAVNGPTGAEVPVFVDASLRVAGGPGFLSAATFQLGTGPVTTICSAVTFVANCTGGPEVFGENVVDTMMVETNTPIAISMTAFAESSLNDVGSSAFIDPFVGIDSNFLISNPEYSLEFSQGIGNSPVVDIPEPATWAMMLIGVFALGAMSRSRRRSALARAA